MFGSSIMDKIRALDIYKKVPSDFAEATYSGAICK